MNRKHRPKSGQDKRRPTHGGSAARPSPAKAAKLRIVGGDLRGRPIEYHGAEFTRPMKDNIRENLFNILGQAVRGAVCFDLFAGTGALAIESISRGAKSAFAVEQNRLAAEVIRKNAQGLKVDDRIEVLLGDAFKLSGQLLASPREDTPWIVFLCPPYTLWHDSLEPLAAVIRLTLDHAPPGSVLVAETEKQFEADKLPAGDWDWRQYGSTRLGFLEPAMRCGLDLNLPEFGDAPRDPD
ncbi:MAG: RsmD family RNA methyltransferase [Pirellulales bacterium]|nr:RsmD family RNA methyltransferase [Pirellulales bacterium]